MREEVAKATLCQPRLTLALLVHSDQYSITVSSRTKHTPSTPAPPTIYPVLPSPSHTTLLPRFSLFHQQFFSFSLASFLDYPLALFISVSPSARSSFNLSPAPLLFLFPSLLFAECTRLSLPGLVTRSPLVLSLFHSIRIYLVVSLVHQPSCLCPAVGSRCSDRKNYRAVFGRSSTKTIESHANDETRLIRDLLTEGISCGLG